MHTTDLKPRFKSYSTFISFHFQKKSSLVFVFSLVLFVNALTAQNVAVGTYTGNGGTAFNVTGLGFTPVCVLVQKSGSGTSFIATNTMGGKVKLNGANALVSNYITSFGSGYFTVGTNSADANTNTITYYYTAFSSNAVATGTFVGSASYQTVTVGFKPKMVWAMGADATWPHNSQMNMVNNEANSFYMLGGAADWHKELLSSYTATAFTVTDYANVGVTYHYAAFNYGKTGSYTGNATARSIVTGVGSHPVFVFAKDQGSAPGATSWYKTTVIPAADSYTFGGALSTLQVTAIGNDGFDLGTSGDANIFGSASEWFALDAADILPVELLSFKGVREEDGIKLLWKTASEINSDYYVLERSAAGIHYEAIGRVEAAGSSFSVLNYSFTDEHPLSGNNYYRLKAVDKDESYAFFKTVVVDFNSGNSTSHISLFPNPAKENTQVNFEAVKNGTAHLEVYDAIGQLVYFSEFAVSKGSNTVNVNLLSLADGYYSIRIVTQNAVSEMLKFCKN